MASGLEERVEQWINGDVNPSDQATLRRLLSRLHAGTETERRAAGDELQSRFNGPLQFGTAGLRGKVGAGQSRMNQATVIVTTAGLGAYLIDEVPHVKERGVVLGRDARFGSAEFQTVAAEVLIALGIRVWWLPDTVVTPMVPFGVQRLGAAAGIMVTASHNPGPDNGYKVYGPNGAQIVSPADRAISQAILAQSFANQVPRCPWRQAVENADERLVVRSDLKEIYLEAIQPTRLVPDASLSELKVVYTAMHGVAGPFLTETLQRQGVRLHPVVEQHQPNPEFPTVAFPNPEEPNALDLALELANSIQADLVLANDPDGDRLAVAVPTRTVDNPEAIDESCEDHKSGTDIRGWRILSGNEIGALLGQHILRYNSPKDPHRLVVNSLVSSRLLEQMAQNEGVHFKQALTGFKNISRVMLSGAEQGLKPVFGFEEALGYAVSLKVLDKDGISAGLLMAELTAVARRVYGTNSQSPILDELETIHRQHGLWISRSRSVRKDGVGGTKWVQTQMNSLRSSPPKSLGGYQIEAQRDLMEDSPSTNLLIFQLESRTRLAIRPSGTEPKLKFYLEIEAEWPKELSHKQAICRADEQLQAIEASLVKLVE